LLDSRNDGLATARFVVCEMETLLSGSYGEATVMAVLLYLFRRMERALDGRRREVGVIKLTCIMRL
jgi:type IV secretory pathway VirB4 component